MAEPLAHSASNADTEPQLYKDHVGGTSQSDGVVHGARRRVEAMVRYHRDQDAAQAVTAAVIDAATFHDLGKLDPENQAALRQGRSAKLPWDHIDAGVAHLSACKACTAAWVVRGHHAPGLPSLPDHFTTKHDRRLRGRRNDDCDPADQQRQIERTERYLPSIVDQHFSVVGIREVLPGKALHGLPLRLALSCLVDADHADSAQFDTKWKAPDAPIPRWAERLTALDRYVEGLSSEARPEASFGAHSMTRVGMADWKRRW